MGMPFLGLCLGHQLLACALGGACGASEVPEIGMMPFQLTDMGAESIFLDNVPEVFHSLQWHSAKVARLPVGRQGIGGLAGLRRAGDELGTTGAVDPVPSGG